MIEPKTFYRKLDALVAAIGKAQTSRNFLLKSGWLREELEFGVNALRAALNYRLFSDAVKSDLQQAVLIQQSLLPAEAPQIRGFEIAGRSQPAQLVGGDLYDYFTSDEDVFGVCIGDASGHGLPAALLVRDVVTGLRMGMEKELVVRHQSKSASEILELIFEEVYAFGNRAKWEDDATVVVVKRVGI